MECGIYVGKVGEISETLKNRLVDISCLQEVRWKAQGAKMVMLVIIWVVLERLMIVWDSANMMEGSD